MQSMLDNGVLLPTAMLTRVVGLVMLIQWQRILFSGFFVEYVYTKEHQLTILSQNTNKEELYVSGLKIPVSLVQF
jgi:hypothetical protein